MTKQEVYALMNGNPAFFLATVEQGLPKVRGMLLFRADENGIVFHTGVTKDVYKQIRANANAQLCFNDFQKNVQVRVSGSLEIVNDRALLDEIVAHPSRAFVRAWLENGIVNDVQKELAVLRMKGGRVKIWTMATNFEPAEELTLD